MGITFNNMEIFCANCGGFDLTFVEDELLVESAKSKFLKIIKCLRCNNFFSKEHIENNLRNFTDKEMLIEIRKKRADMFEHYKSFRFKEPEPKTKSKRKKKIKDKKVSRQESLVIE